MFFLKKNLSSLLLCTSFSRKGIFIDKTYRLGEIFILNKSHIDNKIRLLINDIRKDQSPDGSWDYPFETGVATDCYMIILLRSLQINDDDLIKELTERILAKQEKNGAWKLFYDESDGNLSATVEAFYALVYSGCIVENDNRLLKAKNFIRSKGGIMKTGIFTKIMLSLTGQYRWPAFFPIPPEIMLIPPSFPINFFSFSVYGRANLCPIMILASKKFRIRTEKSPDLSEIINTEIYDDFGFHRSQEWRPLYSLILQSVQRLIGLPEQIHKKALSLAKEYMLERIEADGTFYSYFSSTFLMIFALLALGHSKEDPIIKKAIEGLKSMKTQINGKTHMQYTTADIWNTSLISYVLQEAGVKPTDPIIVRASQYLLSRQHHKIGDWKIHNLKGVPGGWGFSDINTINPDVDDTTAVLRAIKRNVKRDSRSRLAWEKGIQWVFSMQNDDGGWPSFERKINQEWLQFFPIEKGEFLITDPSTVDLTGRTLEFIGSHTVFSKNHPVIQKAVKWLLDNQEKNGSWYGRWGICYLYGTWAAVTGLKAVRVSSRQDSIQKAINWIESIQNRDGGWGESCQSDSKKTFVSLGASTLTHTAWALDTLIAAYSKPSTAIQAGMNFLHENIEKDDWTTSYPAGQGMAGDFYIHYHSYRYIFPLLAMVHYKKKYDKDS